MSKELLDKIKKDRELIVKSNKIVKK